MNQIHMSNDLALLLDRFRYEVQYVDYEKNQWTAPVILTEERAQRIMDDFSVAVVRFSPILQPSSIESFVFERKALTFTQPEMKNLDDNMVTS